MSSSNQDKIKTVIRRLPVGLIGCIFSFLVVHKTAEHFSVNKALNSRNILEKTEGSAHVVFIYFSFLWQL